MLNKRDITTLLFLIFVTSACESNTTELVTGEKKQNEKRIETTTNLDAKKPTPSQANNKIMPTANYLNKLVGEPSEPHSHPHPHKKNSVVKPITPDKFAPPNDGPPLGDLTPPPPPR